MAASGAAATDLGALADGPRPAIHRPGGRKERVGTVGRRRSSGRGSGAVSDRIPSALGPGASHADPSERGPRASAYGWPGSASGRGWPLRPPLASQSVPPSPLVSRGGPRQARRPLLCGGGHRAGAAALVEDHGDLPGGVALLRDQWAECPAGETWKGEGEGTAPRPGSGSGDGPDAPSRSSGSWCLSVSCLPGSRCRWTIKRSCPSPWCTSERSL